MTIWSNPLRRSHRSIAPFLLLSAMALIAAGCTVFPTPMPPDEPVLDAVTPTGRTGGMVGDTAPEFENIESWINSDALTMEDLRGDVVLIDFWTYTCVNCIRTLPYLQEWHNKYADKGLSIVGLHAPEFAFEEVRENVVAASDELGVTWPVAQDNDFSTWREYNNRFWPAKYLVDRDGVVRYTHFGEGAYAETELAIRELLSEAGADLSGIERGTDDGPEFIPEAYVQDPEMRITRELYGGWSRNAISSGLYIAHASYYEGPEQVRTYEDPGDHTNQVMYLQGDWFNGAESIKHARSTENYEDYIALKFHARSANIVIDLEEGVEPFLVKVTIKDVASGEYRPINEAEAGSDIVYEDGESFLRVDSPRMYYAVSLSDFDDREIRFSSNSEHFALFAMTFGAYETVD